MLLLWYRNQLYAIEQRCVYHPANVLLLHTLRPPVLSCRAHHRTSGSQGLRLQLPCRSPAAGAYSEGFVNSKLTQVRL